MPKGSITYNPLFWIALSCISAGIFVASTRFFSVAFPLVNVDISMTRSQALDKAAALTQRLGFQTQNYSDAISFESDSTAQTFIELEGGGKEAFNTMLQNHIYEPYQWKVRHFKEQQTHEAVFFFNPAGTEYGFLQTLSQETNLPSLSPEVALAKATDFAQTWVADFTHYKLVESSQETAPSGRVDHAFVFERTDQTLGEGLYRIKIIVQGDQIGGLLPFIKIPESFTRRYQEMRSYNNSLASAANLLMMLLYFFGGCLIALFFLLRRNWVLPKAALVAGSTVALLSTAAQINELPLAWMQYNTAFSCTGFLFQRIIALIIGFIYNSIFFSVIFMAAESLTRKAFGDHIQLWKLGSRNAASSYQVLGRALFGYLIVAVDVAIIVAFYLITSRYANWWMPSSMLFNPNILATYVPSLSPLAISLQAGFVEECLFRAIPLSIAALLGKRYGKKNWWIGGAFILQAVIFGAAHANYPAQPFYARLVELIIPSFSFGAIYLWLGLFPAIISHVVYDIGWFALPIFVARGNEAFVHKCLVIIGALIPLFIILLQRLRAREWKMLDATFLNRSWHAPEVVTIEQEHPDELPQSVSGWFVQMFLLAWLIAAVGWYRVTPFTQQALPITIDRTSAIERATAHLAQQNITLDQNWTKIASAFTHYTMDPEEKLAQTFVWKKDGSDHKLVYQRLLRDHYLKNPHFLVRFVQFSGDLIERTREYQVHLDHNGLAYHTKYILPESQVGAQLAEADARRIAREWIINNYNLSTTDLVEKSAVAKQLPARKDWVFTFALPSIYSYNEARAQIEVSIAGDTVVENKPFIFVPESWKRAQQNREQIIQSLQMVCFIILFVLFLLGIAAAVSRGNITRTTFFRLYLFFIGLFVIMTANNFGSFLIHCNTSSPLVNQIFMLMSYTIVQAVLQSGGFALILALTLGQRSRHLALPASNIIFLASALGVICAGLSSFVLSTQASIQPLWAAYGPLTSYVPAVTIIAQALTHFTICTAFILLITVLANMISYRWKYGRYFLLPLFIGASAGLSGIMGIAVISTWVIQSCSMGIVLCILYTQLIRHELALIPFMTATFCGMQLIQQCFFSAFDQALIGNGMALVLVLALGVYWTLTLRNQKAALQ